MADSTPTETGATVSNFKETMANMCEFKRNLYKQGLRSGPAYDGKGGNPGIWYDQVFEREATPTGTVNCSRALRVGSTQNGLDVALVASHSNEGPLIIPAGATITLSLLQSDQEFGTFEDAGPSYCVIAPTGGMEVNPDGLICRFAIGNMDKPWAMASLKFTGSISGGKVDCVLSYAPR